MNRSAGIITIIAAGAAVWSWFEGFPTWAGLVVFFITLVVLTAFVKTFLTPKH